MLDIDYLSEIRGWLWENAEIKNTHENFDKLLSKIKELMTNIAEKHNLFLIID